MGAVRPGMMLMATQSDGLGPRQALILRLYDLFRRKGYDGVSIADVSAATGLGKSSLYHHFPGGKAEMAEAVVAHTRAAMEREFFAPLAAATPIADRVSGFLESASRIYGAGEGPCALASLSAAASGGPLGEGVTQLFRDWVDALSQALESGGLPPHEARQRAVRALALIQGGLVLSRGLKDTSAFAEALSGARDELLAGQDERGGTRQR